MRSLNETIAGLAINVASVIYVGAKVTPIPSLFALRELIRSGERVDCPILLSSFFLFTPRFSFAINLKRTIIIRIYRVLIYPL